MPKFCLGDYAILSVQQYPAKKEKYEFAGFRFYILRDFERMQEVAPPYPESDSYSDDRSAEALKLPPYSLEAEQAVLGGLKSYRELQGVFLGGEGDPVSLNMLRNQWHE